MPIASIRFDSILRDGVNADDDDNVDDILVAFQTGLSVHYTA